MDYYADNAYLAPMAAHHLYSKGKNGWGLFYRLEDCILFFTVFSVFARRMEMRVAAFAIMFNHIHATVIDETQQRITLFQRQVGISTAHNFNKEYGRTGQVWHHSYGVAVKISLKRILGNIAYVANNCVAGNMNSHAIDNRWTLLAYYNNPHPFSDPIDKRTCSRRLTRAMKLVNIKKENDEYLDYRTQTRIFSGLNRKEREQMLDYIISSYNFLDYNALIELYGSFEKAIIAIDSNSGSEYKLKDDTGDHSCYQKMLAIMHSFCKSSKTFIGKLDKATTEALYNLFKIHGFKEENICKFLHLTRSSGLGCAITSKPRSS